MPIVDFALFSLSIFLLVECRYLFLYVPVVGIFAYVHGVSFH